MKTNIIWIVDDDPIYQIIISKTIKESNLFSDYSSFTNPKEAIAQLKSNTNPELHPRFILLDINMPQINGWEFVEEVQKNKNQLQSKISIYIASSSIAEEDKNKAKQYKEIAGFFSKPISVENLIAINETK